MGEENREVLTLWRGLISFLAYLNERKQLGAGSCGTAYITS